MTTDTSQNIIAALDELLNAERKALLHGDLDAITRLLEQKEALIGRLGAMEDSEQAALTKLQGKVARNQALLDGALRGIRMVASRMSALRQIRKTVETYDEKGCKTVLKGMHESNVEKRA